MDIEEISQTLYKEKNQTLKTIPADFYLEAEKYIRELEKEIGKINNPRSPESKMLNDEHERALSDLETIFMKRIGKVITRATIQSHADKPISKDIEKLLPAEKMLYDLVLQGIEAVKIELLGPILYPNSGKIAVWPRMGEARQASAQIPAILVETTGREVIVAAEGKGTETGKTNINEEYVVVRILKDLPTFTGADGRNYTVNAEDVVVLPQLNATGLIKRNAAKLVAAGDKNSGEKNSEKN
ncbi:MAG TPA: DNA replication complex GINS family protein [Methanosarcina sp.]|nr:DNA replication complex GINS family protein [Methanosarcina sp.]